MNLNNENFRKMLNDRFGMFVHHGILSATVGDTSNAVNPNEEAGRYPLSKTGIGNIRIRRDAGTFTIPAPENTVFCLHAQTKAQTPR